MNRARAPQLSLDAMRFGSQRELEIALTELKWLKESTGSITERDYETVSHKYKFPIGFLKEGLRGLSFPGDYMVSKSRWFPIVYSWRDHERQLGINLFKFQIGLMQTKFRFQMLLVVLFVVLVEMGYVLRNLFDLGLYETLLIVVIPFGFFLISLGAELRNSVSEKKMKLDEFKSTLKDEGFQELIDGNERFITRHFKMIAYAGGVFLRNIQKSAPMDFFYVGMTETEKKIKSGRLNRLLTRLHVFPRTSESSKKEKIPMFYGENPFAEYRKRIEELARNAENQNQKSP
jgi:hypothetical protein